MKHPATILAAEMKSRDLSATRLASAINVPTNRITGILNGTRSISPDTAIRLGFYFGNAAWAWIEAQARLDLDRELAENGATIRRELSARELV